MLKSYKSQEHHEMGPQKSYKHFKTTILQHFSRPESWYHSFAQIMQSYHPNDQKNTFFQKWKKRQNSRAKKKRSKIRAPRPPRGKAGLDAGAHESPLKIDFETEIRGAMNYPQKLLETKSKC